MNAYKAAKRRNTIITNYERATKGAPKGEPLFVRSFAEARPTIRRNTFIAGRKAPLMTSFPSEATLKSATLVSYRIKAANEKIATDRLWGEL